MELVRHEAKEHHEEEEEWNIKFQSTPKSHKDKDNISQEDSSIHSKVKTIDENICEDKVDEIDELEHLEDELNSLKMELGFK